MDYCVLKSIYNVDWGLLCISVFYNTFLISTVTVKQFTACKKSLFMIVCKLESVIDQYDRKSELTLRLCVYSASKFTKCVFKC
jgi:hypothetical protein